MNPLDFLIVDFINRHQVMTFATTFENKPYCATLFYAFSGERAMLVFISEKTTKHIQDALHYPEVAGAIALETPEVAKVEGIQFTGKFKELTGTLALEMKEVFSRKFPFIPLPDISLWGIELDLIKMTHNEKLGFGNKLLWNK